MKRFRGKNLAVIMVFALLFSMVIPSGVVSTFAAEGISTNGETVIESVYGDPDDYESTAPTTGEGIQPIYVSGNPTCKHGESYKIDDIEGRNFDGVYSVNGGTITITGSTNNDFDWEASPNIRINKVIVKAGPGAYVYTYSEFLSSDSGLFTPDNRGGQQADVSHVTFCYTVIPEVELDEDSLNLTSMCIDEDLADTETRWRITNDSGVDVDFTYEVYGTSTTGSGTIPATHTTAERFDNPFYLNVNVPHPATLIIRWGDDKEFSVTKASSGDICEGVPTGTLTVEKELLDYMENEISEDNTEFTLNITGPNDYDENHTFTVNQQLELSELELGTYIITEIDIPQGYSFITMDAIDGEVTLTEGDNEVTVVITNMMEEPVMITGSLTVQKLLFGYHESEVLNEEFVIDEDETEFTVNITGPEGYDEEYTFSVNEPLVLSELLLGDYTVQEINIPEGYTFEFMDPSNGEISFTLNENEVIVTITNMLEEDSDPTDDGDDPTDDGDDPTDDGDDPIDDDDDDDDDDVVDDDDDDDAIDDDDDDDVTIQVDPDPTPLGPPVIEVEPEIMEIQVEPVPLGEPEPVEEEEEEVIILDEEVPLGEAELPQTGERNPIGFYLLGLLLTAIGVKFKKVF